MPVALTDASLQTWIHMTDGTHDIYYDKGSLAGLALDIMIRDASDNAASLDDVMRALYAADYKKGRGFTPAEWWGAVSRAAKGANTRSSTTGTSTDASPIRGTSGSRRPAGAFTSTRCASHAWA